MDEHTLNDLLECSVCLERLDTSSKVLPCQHTFCRKCLEVIISSHQELRCPECRVLVDIKIDDLPPNVLLMRILEGMRNAATTKTQQQQQQQKQQQCNLQNNETDRLSNNTNKSNQQEKSQQHLQQFMQQKKIQQDQQQQQQQQTNTQPRRSLLPHAYAMHDFESTETSDLSFKKGDLVLLKRKIDDNWCVGQANGVEGTFPINYVKVIVPLPSPQCIALYDFKMGPNEEEGCLSFKKGDIIHVFRRVDHNWAEGRIGGTIGIFPIAFVRLNALAEQMLDVNQRQQTTTVTTIPLTTPTISTTSAATNATNTVTNTNSFASNSNSLASSSDSCSTTPNQSQEHTPLHINQTKTNNALPSRRSSTEDTSTTSDEMMMLGASGIDVVQLRYREGREKRHSLNALLNDAAASNATADNVESRENVPRNLLQSNRHSAEILSLPHELNTPSTSTTTTTTTCMPPPPPQQQQTRVNVLKSPVIVQQMVPPSLPWGYLALYPYKPRKNDELELKKGCVYIVTERCLDGWFKGKNWQDTLGVFPGNYVTPLRPRDQKQLMHQWKHVPLVSMAPMSNITTTTATTTLAATTNRSNLPILQIPPPDAPPRQLTSVSPSASPPASTTSCASVWTKPLGHTVEAFFSRSNTIHNNNNNNTDKSKEKETVIGNSNTTTTNTTSSSSSSSTTNAAVSLMKRLTNMKSRSKSPAAHLVSPQETKQQQPQPQQHQAHAIHVRSGSCPSQLLQNMPKDSRVNAQQQQQQQQEKLQHHIQQQSANSTAISFGSQRLKGCKERPILPNARQSLDANMFRNTYQQHASSGVQMQHPPKQQQQQQQSQQAQYNFVNQNTSQTLQSINHRKSQSLDANTVLMGNNFNTAAHPLPLPLPPPMPATAAHKNYAGRYRCIVPYPPNSEFELELHVDDIIFVNRKPKNGWLKGTCVRTNKTGLFPASFVEPICAPK